MLLFFFIAMKDTPGFQLLVCFQTSLIIPNESVLLIFSSLHSWVHQQVEEAHTHSLYSVFWWHTEGLKALFFFFFWLTCLDSLDRYVRKWEILFVLMVLCVCTVCVWCSSETGGFIGIRLTDSSYLLVCVSRHLLWLSKAALLGVKKLSLSVCLSCHCSSLCCFFFFIERKKNRLAPDMKQITWTV